VPLLTVWFAIALLLASVVAFLLLVQRLSTLQISRVLAYAGDQGRVVIARDYRLLQASETIEATPTARSCRRGRRPAARGSVARSRTRTTGGTRSTRIAKGSACPASSARSEPA